MNLLVNEAGNCVALSHAHRFDKSKESGMLKVYYSKGCASKCLFEYLEIAETDNWDKYFNKFNVIHLDMSTYADNYKENLVEYVIKVIYEEIAKEILNIKFVDDFVKILDNVYRMSGVKFAIIIYEWESNVILLRVNQSKS